MNYIKSYIMDFINWLMGWKEEEDRIEFPKEIKSINLSNFPGKAEQIEARNSMYLQLIKVEYCEYMEAIDELDNRELEEYFKLMVINTLKYFNQGDNLKEIIEDKIVLEDDDVLDRYWKCGIPDFINFKLEGKPILSIWIKGSDHLRRLRQMATGEIKHRVWILTIDF